MEIKSVKKKEEEGTLQIPIPRPRRDPNYRRKLRYDSVYLLRSIFNNGIYFTEEDLRHYLSRTKSQEEIDHYLMKHTHLYQTIMKNDTHYFILDQDPFLPGYWMRLDNLHIPILRCNEILIKQHLRSIYSLLVLVLDQSQQKKLEIYLQC